MIVKNVLIAARKLIEDESHWTRGAYARREDDRPISCWDSQACKYCAAGALDKVLGSGNKLRREVVNTMNAICKEKYNYNLVKTNDCKGHKAVLEVFDVAIESAL